MGFWLKCWVLFALSCHKGAWVRSFILSCRKGAKVGFVLSCHNSGLFVLSCRKGTKFGVVVAVFFSCNGTKVLVLSCCKGTKFGVVVVVLSCHNGTKVLVLSCCKGTKFRVLVVVVVVLFSCHNGIKICQDGIRFIICCREGIRFGFILFVFVFVFLFFGFVFALFLCRSVDQTCTDSVKKTDVLSSFAFFFFSLDHRCFCVDGIYCCLVLREWFMKRLGERKVLMERRLIRNDIIVLFL